MSKRESTSSEIALAEPNKKMARVHYEKLPTTKFKRYIHALAPQNQKKKIEYSNDPKVIQRRRTLNQRRACVHRILVQLLKNGQFYDKQGKQYQLINGIVCTPDDKQYFIISKTNDLNKKTYTEELQLHDIIPVDNNFTKEDLEFNDLLQRFVAGDPEVVGLIKNKRAFTSVENPIMQDIDYLKKRVQNRLDDVSDSDSSDEREDGQ